MTGEQLEDLNKNPSKIQKELAKIVQKNKNKKVAVERQSSPLDEPAVVDKDVPELPFSEVRPLPTVERGQAKKNVVSADNVNDEDLLEVPKLSAESGFKNRAPLQWDERAKDLVQDALKNTICITTEDMLHVSEPMRQELRKLLVKKREKKSVSFGAEVDIEDEAPEPNEMISADKLPGVTYEILAEDTNGMTKGSVVVQDPVLQYLNTLKPGEKPKSVIVAAESHALRTVYPLVNGVGHVESLLDPGS